MEMKQVYALLKVPYRLSSKASNCGNLHKTRGGSGLDSRL